MLYENNNVSEELLNQAAIDVTGHLKGKCKFCPRGFEAGEKIVFCTIKTVQMRWIEADVEKAEPEGFGEQHLVDIVNAHLPCAISNMHALRGVTIPKKLA